MRLRTVKSAARLLWELSANRPSIVDIILQLLEGVRLGMPHPEPIPEVKDPKDAAYQLRWEVWCTDTAWALTRSLRVTIGEPSNVDFRTWQNQAKMWLMARYQDQSGIPIRVVAHGRGAIIIRCAVGTFIVSCGHVVGAPGTPVYLDAFDEYQGVTIYSTGRPDVGLVKLTAAASEYVLRVYHHLVVPMNLSNTAPIHNVHRFPSVALGPQVASCSNRRFHSVGEVEAHDLGHPTVFRFLRWTPTTKSEHRLLWELSGHSFTVSDHIRRSLRIVRVGPHPGHRAAAADVAVHEREWQDWCEQTSTELFNSLAALRLPLIDNWQRLAVEWLRVHYQDRSGIPHRVLADDVAAPVPVALLPPGGGPLDPALRAEIQRYVMHGCSGGALVLGDEEHLAVAAFFTFGMVTETYTDDDPAAAFFPRALVTRLTDLPWPRLFEAMCTT